GRGDALLFPVPTVRPPALSSVRRRGPAGPRRTPSLPPLSLRGSESRPVERREQQAKNLLLDHRTHFLVQSDRADVVALLGRGVGDVNRIAVPVPTNANTVPESAVPLNR